MRDDSQDDSQACELWRLVADNYVFLALSFELGRTLMDACGCQTRGLQNRQRALETRAHRARPLIYV